MFWYCLYLFAPLSLSLLGNVLNLKKKSIGIWNKIQDMQVHYQWFLRRVGPISLDNGVV